MQCDKLLTLAQQQLKTGSIHRTNGHIPKKSYNSGKRHSFWVPDIEKLIYCFNKTFDVYKTNL